MAFWTVKKGRVYIYVHEGSKQKQVPRELYSHLDGQPDHNIDYWISERLGKPKPKSELTDRTLLLRVEEYLRFKESRGKSFKTINQIKHLLLDFTLPFFTAYEPIFLDPAHWGQKSIKLHDHLVKLGAGPQTIRVANIALKGFWKWLQEEGHLASSLPLPNLRPPICQAQETPLRRRISPEEVLEFVTNPRNDERCRKLALFGYFFSLRPQELVALRPSDFKGGDEVANFHCGQANAESGLFNRFAVHITRQRDERGQEKVPKAFSKRWVACFDERAARLMVEFLERYVGREEEPLFPLQMDRYYKLWRKKGLEGTYLKDTRRASILWLATKAVAMQNLQRHAGHRYAGTLDYYYRVPEENTEKNKVNWKF